MTPPGPHPSRPPWLDLHRWINIWYTAVITKLHVWAAGCSWDDWGALIQSLFHYQFHHEKSESCCSNKLQMMMIVTLKRVHFKCDGWDIFINVTRRYIGIAFCAILEKMPSFNLIDYAIYIIKRKRKCWLSWCYLF